MIVANYKEHRFPVIYKMTNLKNGKIYVGSAKSFYRRYHEYRRFSTSKYKASRPIEWAIKRDGFESFVFDIIEKVESVESLIEREQYWIDALRPFDPKVGYNMCEIANSTLGLKHSEETRVKISNRAKGRIISKETREKISESGLSRNQKIKDETNNPILQIDMESLGVISEYKSIFKIVEKFGEGVRETVVLACRRINRSSVGFFWCYKSEYLKNGFEPNPVQKRKCFTGVRVARPVVQTLNGKEIAKFRSIREAATLTGGTSSNIGQCCLGRVGSYKGFQWEYVKDQKEIEEIKESMRKTIAESAS